jgi:hypothetical protein
MEALLTKLEGLFIQSLDVEGAVPTQSAPLLDALCAALVGAVNTCELLPTASAQVLAGLQAVQQIAGEAGSAGVPARVSAAGTITVAAPLTHENSSESNNSWQYTLEGLPNIGLTFILKRGQPAPAELFTQLDHRWRLHGMFYLILGHENEELVFSFDLMLQADGWYLRILDEGRQVQFQITPHDTGPIPWTNASVLDLWGEFLPSGGVEIEGWLETASEPASPAPPTPSGTDPAILSEKTIFSPRKLDAITLYLVNIDGGEFIPLVGRLTIGRDPSNGLNLDDNDVSRNHAVIEPIPGGWMVRDLNSTNGVALNGVRIKDTAALNAGDVLQMGRIRLRLELR